MAGYFSYFPDTFHDLRNTGSKTQVTNILRRFKVKDVLQDRADIFYEYSIQDGDRPDIIAEKFYGNANYAWIVLHYNDIIDPFFDLLKSLMVEIISSGIIVLSLLDILLLWLLLLF